MKLIHPATDQVKLKRYFGVSRVGLYRILKINNEPPLSEFLHKVLILGEGEGKNLSRSIKNLHLYIKNYIKTNKAVPKVTDLTARRWDNWVSQKHGFSLRKYIEKEFKEEFSKIKKQKQIDLVITAIHFFYRKNKRWPRAKEVSTNHRKIIKEHFGMTITPFIEKLTTEK